jgi:hypothetical protein
MLQYCFTSVTRYELSRVKPNPSLHYSEPASIRVTWIRLGHVACKRVEWCNCRSKYNNFFPLAQQSPSTPFLDHTQRSTTFGRTSLDEWSARRRDVYLTKQKQSQRTDIHAAGEIRSQNLSRRATADLRFRPRGHWDRLTLGAVNLACVKVWSSKTKRTLTTWNP